LAKEKKLGMTKKTSPNPAPGQGSSDPDALIFGGSGGSNSKRQHPHGGQRGRVENGPERKITKGPSGQLAHTSGGTQKYE